MYFSYRWFTLDFFLIMLNVIFYFINLDSKINNIFIVNRMFRVAFAFRTLLYNEPFISSKWYIS